MMKIFLRILYFNFDIAVCLSAFNLWLVEGNPKKFPQIHLMNQSREVELKMLS